ncbi:MAG: mechanosensitive ion channel family protein [Mesorhizobium sp.]|nr:MAG: mechanosensitive ion channel family protein [Mesorhizobium sp.]
MLVLVVRTSVPCIAYAELGATSQDGNASATIEQRNAELEIISNSVSTNTDSQALRGLRAQVLEIQMAATEALATLEPELAGLDEKLRQLGEASKGEDADIGQQRNQIQARRAELDSAIKRGRLLATNAATTLETINRSLSAEFNRSTFQKENSPLSSGFWIKVGNSMETDFQRVDRVLNQSFTKQGGADFPSIVLAALSVAGALLAFGPARRRLESLGFDFMKHKAPGTRVRRSGLVLWFTTVGTLTVVLAFNLLALALRLLGFFANDAASSLLTLLLGATSFAAFVVVLGQSLLLNDRGSWRLPPLSDATARAWRHYPMFAAVIMAFGVALVETSRLAGVSSAGNALLNLVIALCYVLLIAAALRTGRLLRAHRPAEDGAVFRAPAPWLLAVELVLHVALLTSVLALLFGYISLALFIGRQVVWIAVIASGAYLLVLAIDDFAQAVCSPEGDIARYLNASFRVRPGTVRQIGVVGSAMVRVSVMFAAVVLVFAPFGPGTGNLFSGIADVSSITVAGITIEPAAVVRAAIVFGLTLAAVRLVLRWFEDTYLPTTGLDSGARNSAVTVVKYAGFILACLWGVNTLGIGVERIALVVSALSVGIGFGLQAITQNFISGLILLAERPLKIGDTVRVGTEEGDVRKISVRATEIQISDRSALIVPNSELITKTIRNMTPSEPIGRMEIEFSVPIDHDPKRIQMLVLAIYSEHEGVLDEPQPVILIEAIVDGRINFKSYAFVASPRAVADTKSALLFTLLERFRQADITLHTS